MPHILEQNLYDLYETLLLGPLTTVYTAKKNTQATELDEISNLIIDKFAIHSSSFFHLSKGIIELRKSGEKVKMTGYDLFTVNATLRVILENYATFNNIFIEPQTKEEQLFRFLLWKIDGLLDKQKFAIPETGPQNVKEILEADKARLQETIQTFEKTLFYESLDKTQLYKIYKPELKKVNWRFRIDNERKIVPLKIIDLIEHVFKIDAFTNFYRYSSVHTHTNYLAIEHFKQTRGKQISPQYADPILKLGVYATCLLIWDICTVNQNANKELKTFPSHLQEYIEGIYRAIKQ
jgi:hypothetical protein